jgi:hypothetical protein
MDMREALNAAFDGESKDEPPEVVESAAPESQEQVSAEVETPEPAADNKTVPPAAEGGDPAKSAPEKPVAPAAPETVPGTTHRVDRAPASWKKDAKGEWAALPLQARQEIHRREMEVQKVLNDTAPIRQEIQQFKDAVNPYMARIQSLGATPIQAVSHLLQADYTMATGTPQQKAQFIDKLLQDYNVDIAELDAAISRRLGGQQAPQQQGFDPSQINQLVQQQLQQALAPLYQQQQQARQQVEQQAVTTVDQMSLDPKYPHFEDVRQDMADLIELSSRRGVALSLEQAYTRAVSMNPEISAMNQATQLNQRAQRAAAAAVSVSGSPVGGGTQSHVTSGNLRDDLEAAFGGNRI